VSRRRWRVLVLMHPALVPPEDADTHDERSAHAWKTEYDVLRTLRGLGHAVEPLGVQDELLPIRRAVSALRPHIVFNLLEEFQGLAELDQHVVSYLELLKVPYTGCNPRGLVLARDKALSKKLLAFHRIPAPGFAVFPRGRRIRPPRDLGFPLIVKSLTEEASLGIAQASIVDDAERLEERVRFIHDSVGSDAIVERFIDGRELYVGVLGHRRLRVLPTWELRFGNLPRGAVAIATARVKHDPDYQAKRGIYQQRAELTPAEAKRIARTTRRVARILHLDGYARVDYRLAPDGTLYFLEANPNPEIAEREEFASAAEAAGLRYPRLLETILRLGLARGTPAGSTGARPGPDPLHG
jgi:D-alanine-D-alanine ligase